MKKFKFKVQIDVQGELPEDDFKVRLKEAKQQIQELLQKECDNLTLITII